MGWPPFNIDPESYRGAEVAVKITKRRPKVHKHVPDALEHELASAVAEAVEADLAQVAA